MINFKSGDEVTRKLKSGSLQLGQMGIDREGDVHFRDVTGKHFMFRSSGGWVGVNDPVYMQMEVTPVPAGSTITITSEV